MLSSPSSADSLQSPQRREAKYVEFDVSVGATVRNLVPPTSITMRSVAPLLACLAPTDDMVYPFIFIEESAPTWDAEYVTPVDVI